MKHRTTPAHRTSRISARRRPAARTALAAAALGALLAGCAGSGDPVSFDAPHAVATDARSASATGTGSAQSEAERLTRLPTGPKARFTQESTLDDGTAIAVTTLAGRKSGFTGKVWVWAPKQYFEPRYARSGFPVLIALPGGRGYPKNYWIGAGLKLQSSIARWSQEGGSLPFLVVMPVLNADGKHFYDGSDIPGQPRMGTWLAQDVPDFVRANFRTFKSRDGWAFMGSSSGGFVGLKTVLKYPDQFKAVIASGPDLVPDSPLWKGYEEERAADNPANLAAALIARGGPDVYLAFQIGTTETGMGNLRKFIGNFGRGPVKTRLQVIPGGTHNAKSYIRGMGEGSMHWISEQMQPPIAEPGTEPSGPSWVATVPAATPAATPPATGPTGPAARP
ncbi:esterase family protein [Streptomyces bambusae]|uniref:alpha/beta hydrolase n=1 Tax=Streptomyces bambusae TaxID=1550616 RepID=UPI001CFC4786|nr:alpha/beta hydrolase-fold protein [Streptomyces bambusae]MCB5169038.1 esterase family protein [Streptomyces bambusae]